MLRLVNGADGKRYVPFYSASSSFCNYYAEWFEVNGEFTAFFIAILRASFRRILPLCSAILLR